jgi:acyl carrier protein
MPKRNSPNDIKEIDDLNRLKDIVNDKRNAKRAVDKKTRRDRHYEKQFIKNTIKSYLETKLKMTKPEIIEKLKSIVKPYIKNQEAFDNLTESTDFINDLQINSANLVDVILDIEEVFDVVISNEEMEKMLDVKSALEIIETKLSKK